MTTQEQQQAIDLCNAQFAIDHHPDASPFWDSGQGQDVLALVKSENLKPTTDDRYRRAWHAQQMREGSAA